MLAKTEHNILKQLLTFGDSFSIVSDLVVVSVVFFYKVSLCKMFVMHQFTITKKASPHFNFYLKNIKWNTKLETILFTSLPEERAFDFLALEAAFFLSAMIERFLGSWKLI